MVTNTLTIEDPVELADSQAVVDHLVHKTPLDPAVYRRVQERASQATEDLRTAHGVRDLAVDLIRQVRDE